MKQWILELGHGFLFKEVSPSSHHTHGHTLPSQSGKGFCLFPRLLVTRAQLSPAPWATAAAQPRIDMEHAVWFSFCLWVQCVAFRVICSRLLAWGFHLLWEERQVKLKHRGHVAAISPYQREPAALLAFVRIRQPPSLKIVKVQEWVSHSHAHGLKGERQNPAGLSVSRPCGRVDGWGAKQSDTVTRIKDVPLPWICVEESYRFVHTLSWGAQCDRSAPSWQRHEMSACRHYPGCIQALPVILITVCPPKVRSPV